MNVSECTLAWAQASLDELTLPPTVDGDSYFSCLKKQLANSDRKYKRRLEDRQARERRLELEYSRRQAQIAEIRDAIAVLAPEDRDTEAGLLALADAQGIRLAVDGMDKAVAGYTTARDPDDKGRFLLLGDIEKSSGLDATEDYSGHTRFYEYDRERSFDADPATLLSRMAEGNVDERESAEATYAYLLSGEEREDTQPVVDVCGWQVIVPDTEMARAKADKEANPTTISGPATDPLTGLVVASPKGYILRPTAIRMAAVEDNVKYFAIETYDDRLPRFGLSEDVPCRNPKSTHLMPTNECEAYIMPDTIVDGNEWIVSEPNSQLRGLRKSKQVFSLDAEMAPIIRHDCEMVDRIVNGACLLERLKAFNRLVRAIPLTPDEKKVYQPKPPVEATWNMRFESEMARVRRLANYRPGLACTNHGQVKR